MDPLTKSLAHFSRRGILKSGALALLPFAIPSEKYAMADQQPMTANGGTDPYPIPSLDKNGRPKPRTVAYLPLQRTGRAFEYLYRHGHRQSGKPDRVRQSHYRLRCDARRILGGSRNTARDFHTHMTNVVQGAGGPCKSNTRLSSSDFAVWTLLGRAGPGAWPHHQSRWEHFHARNAERASGRPAALAGSGVHCHSRKHDFQDGLENHWRTREI